MFFKISRKSKKAHIYNKLEINLFIQRDNLKNEKWKMEKPIPALKELLMKFYNCLMKSFQSRHKIIDKSRET
jgi:hypothetical protein